MTDRENIIIGLAGHIDHGKTTLIKALNNFDGDSLKEEKERGITLDLSFSNLTLGNRNIAFIDVPGHEKLVKNMIAGAFGIDILLLVVAADDGIMPQSLEHINIANFLGVKKCICVISKIDKVDESRLNALKQDIKNIFENKDIHLESILRFSAYKDLEYHVTNIKKALSSVEIPQRYDFGILMYYIDRVFSIKGAGCVTTGSMISGSCQKDEKLYICDIDKEVLARGIEIHGENSTFANISQRVALNLSGIESNQLKRGMLISKKGILRGFDTIDAILQSFPSQDISLHHNAIYQLHIGSKRSNVKLSILEEISPNRFFVTLKSDELIYGVYNQRFILRDGDRSLAGGTILNPIADPIKKSQKIELLKDLNERRFDKAFEKMLDIHKLGFGLISSMQRFNLSHAQALDIAKTLNIFVDEDALVLYPLSSIDKAKNIILDTMIKNKNALLSAESMNQKLKWCSISLLQRAFDELLDEKMINKKDNFFVSKNFGVKDINEFVKDKIYQSIDEQRYTPLAPYNIYDILDIPRFTGDHALKQLTSSGKVVRLEHNLFISVVALNSLLALMRDIIKTNGFIDIHIFRDKLPISRKYLVAYLDYLDKFSDIYKEENKRFLKH